MPRLKLCVGVPVSQNVTQHLLSGITLYALTVFLVNAVAAATALYFIPLVFKIFILMLLL